MGRMARVGRAALVAGMLMGVAGAPHGAATATAEQTERDYAGRRVDIMDDMMSADLAAHGEDSTYLPWSSGGRVSLVIATRLGHTAAVKAAVSECGGVTLFELEAIGYLRVAVPSSCVAVVRRHVLVDASRFDGGPTASFNPWVDDARLDSRARFQPQIADKAPTNGPDAASPSGVAQPENLSEAEAARRRAAVNGGDAMGVDRLRQAHPSFDGRGVTIAFVEDGAPSIPLTHPSLRSATTIDGKSIPKVADIMPMAEDVLHRIVAPLRAFTSSELTANLGPNGTWQLPRPGTFSLGRFEYGAQMFYILWDRQSRQGWVDINHDGSFADEQAVPDSQTAQDITAYRAGSVPWQGARLQLWFGQTGEPLLVNFATARHNLMCVSVAAGSFDKNNLAGGIAPGARVVLVGAPNEINSVHGSLEGLLAAIARPDVDMVSTSMVVSQDSPAADRAFTSLIISRATRIFNKPIVSGADNTSVSESVQGLSGMLSVGAYAEAAVLRVVDGLSIATRTDTILTYSARGPSQHGGLAPDFIAPAYRVAALDCDDATWAKRQPRAFNLPRCYQVSGGTSAAGPMFAGMVATLISGAKQQGLTLDVRHLHWALRATTRFLPDTPAHAQGDGLPQADRAWALLSKDQQPPDITIEGHVQHVLRDYAPPDEPAHGLYEREGWRVGDHAERSLTLTRTSGPSTAQEYDLEWLGNDGTFRVNRTVTLPRDAAVRVPVSISGLTEGMHSAILVVRDRESKMAVAQISCAVLVAESFTAARDAAVTYDAKVEPYEPMSRAFYVPPDVQRLHLEYSSSVRMWVGLYEPGGWSYHRFKVDGASYAALETSSDSGTQSLDIPSPHPGTWILLARHVRTPGPPEAARVRASLTLHALDVKAEGTSSEALNVRLHERYNTPLDPASVSLGTRTSVTRTLDPSRGPTVYPFDVPKNSGAFQLAISSQAEAFQGYLYECTTGTCQRYDSLIPAGRLYQVRINRPSAGTWKVVLTAGPLARAADTISIERTMIDADVQRPRWTAAASDNASDLTMRISLSPEQAGKPGTVAVINSGISAGSGCHAPRAEVRSDPRAGCVTTPGVLVPVGETTSVRPTQPTAAYNQR
jgi:hypothetical protein